MQCLTWVSIGFAGLAATLWAWSATVNLPAVSGTYLGIEGLGDFYQAIKKVSRLNMYAAISAFVSAALQALTIYLGPTVR